MIFRCKQYNRLYMMEENYYFSSHLIPNTVLLTAAPHQHRSFCSTVSIKVPGFLSWAAIINVRLFTTYAQAKNSSCPSFTDYTVEHNVSCVILTFSIETVQLLFLHYLLPFCGNLLMHHTIETLERCLSNLHDKLIFL